MTELYKKIAQVGKQYKADKIMLYGSRARGDNRERSDIDIAVFGMPKGNQALFNEAIEQLPTLLDFDIVFVTDRIDEALLNNINKDGVVIMNKFSEKLGKFSDSIRRLEEALN